MVNLCYGAAAAILERMGTKALLTGGQRHASWRAV